MNAAQILKGIKQESKLFLLKEYYESIQQKIENNNRLGENFDLNSNCDDGKCLK